jgi:hypothetical protein
MSVGYNPKIVTSGLRLCLDPANIKSYPGSGTAWKDLSGLSRDATLTSAPTFSGGTAIFNGTSNYATIASNADWGFSGSGTVIAWSKDTTVTGYTVGYQKSGWQGYLMTTGYIVYSGQSGSNDFTGSFAVTNGVWYMTSFVINRTSGNYFLYKNGGTQAGTGAITHPSLSAAPLYIGARGAVPSDYFTGAMGAVQIYNRALSAAEIAQNFNALRGRYGL